MSFSNLNFDECESRIHNIITNILHKYHGKCESVDPKTIIKDLTELDECIRVILTETLSNNNKKVQEVSERLKNVIEKIENNKPTNVPNDAKEEIYKKLKTKLTQIDLEYRKTLKKNISLNKTLETVKSKTILLEKQLKHTLNSLTSLQQQINENEKNEGVNDSIQSMKNEISSTLDSYTKIFTKTPISTPVDIKARSLTPILLSSIKSSNKTLNINRDDDYAKHSLSFSGLHDEID